MLNFFMAGPDLVSWDLTALGPQGDGPFRLVVHHATGSITEHFDTVTGALIRQGQLEALLVAARGATDAYDVKPLPGPRSKLAVSHTNGTDSRDGEQPVGEPVRGRRSQQE